MQRKRMDERVRPKDWVMFAMLGVFMVMAVLCALYIYFRVFN